MILATRPDFIARPDFATLDRLESLSSEERVAIFREPYSFLLFFAFYFPHFCKSPFADFHLDMAMDLGDLETGRIRELGWFTFRESAKSAFAMAWLVKCIVNGTFKYPNVDCYERDNSERFLFDVVVNLQSNERILTDYGQLFNQTGKSDVKTQKRISDFLTENGVRVEAHTTQEPVRGRRHREFRPDLLIFDDFENLKTIRSEAATKEVREHLAEFKGGIDQRDGRVLFLGNKLSEDGNVALLMRRAKEDPMFRVREIWMLDEEGNPSWPERHVLTDAELVASPLKVSIETIRRSMRDPDVGDANFEREMLGVIIDPTGEGADRQGYYALFKPDMVRLTSREFARQPPFVIGVDPAGEGSDKTKIAVRSAFMAKIVRTELKSTGKSVASLVLEVMKEFSVPARSVVIDAFGVGYKVVKELSLLGHNVTAVNVGEREKCQTDGYLNDRAWMYFLLRDWMLAGGEICDSPDETWKKEFKSIRFFTDEKGVKRILSKKEIIKRGYHSPDSLDSIALSCLAELGSSNRARIKHDKGEFNPYAVI